MPEFVVTGIIKSKVDAVVEAENWEEALEKANNGEVDGDLVVIENILRNFTEVEENI